MALNLAVGDFERNGDIYGHWGGMGCRVRKTRASNLFEYHCVTTVNKIENVFLKNFFRSKVGVEHYHLIMHLRF